MKGRVKHFRMLPFLLGICFLCSMPYVFAQSLYAQQAGEEQQRYSFDFSGISMAEALETIAAQTSTDLVYDPGIVGNQFVYRRLQGNSIQQLLTRLFDKTDLDYLILSSGTFVVIKSSKKEPALGSLTGQVVDSVTGEPLQGATVMIADASGGTVTNRAGQFNLNGLVSGRQELVFSYIGYEPVRRSILIPESGNIRERIPLKQKPVDIFPVVIYAHRSLMPGHQHQQTATAWSEWNVGGRQKSAIQSLSLFSGVQHGLPLTGTHIQGGQRSEHRLYLDGIPVYNPYSFGQLFSAFSPYAINRVEVEKAGFGASAGSHIAGKIDLKHATTSPNGNTAVFQADPLSTNAFGAGVLNTDSGKRLELMAAYRSSLWGVYEDPVLSGTLSDWDVIDPLLYNLITTGAAGSTMTDFTPLNNRSDISFYDLHFAGAFEATPYQRLSFSIYTGNNSLFTDVLAGEGMQDDRIYMFSRDSYSWNNTAAQVGYDWIASPRLDLSAQLGYSMNRMGHAYTMVGNEFISSLEEQPNTDEANLMGLISQNLEHGSSQRDSNLMQHYIMRLAADYAFSPGLSLQTGIQADRVISEFDLSGLFYLPAVDAQQSTILSSYSNVRWTLAGPLHLKVGSRFTLLEDSGRFYAEPRAQIQYDRVESRLGFWSLRLAGGIYRQFINQFDITNAGPSSIVPAFTIWAHDSRLQQPKAYHTSLSFLVEPTGSTRIQTEGWMRLQPAGYITSYNRLLTNTQESRMGFDSFAEVTEMQAWGAGITINQELLASRLNVMAGYDYSNAEVNMQSQFGRWMPAPWNHPHSVQARVIGRVTSQLTIVGKWQRVMGRSWAFRQSYYDFLMMHDIHTIGQFDLTRPERDRLPSFDQVDLTLVYARTFGFSNVEARLDLINVLNRRNVVDRGIHASATHDDGSQELAFRSRRLPGFNPSVSIQVSF